MGRFSLNLEVLNVPVHSAVPACHAPGRKSKAVPGGQHNNQAYPLTYNFLRRLSLLPLSPGETGPLRR